MSTTLRPFESYLDEVAKEKLNQSYEMVLTRIDLEVISGKTVNSIVTEAANRMLEDAFKAQKEIASQQDEIIGRLTRENAHLQDNIRCRQEWLYKAKQQAGYPTSVSFDDVWEDALLALEEQRKNDPF